MSPTVDHRWLHAAPTPGPKVRDRRRPAARRSDTTRSGGTAAGLSTRRPVGRTTVTGLGVGQLPRVGGGLQGCPAAGRRPSTAARGAEQEPPRGGQSGRPRGGCVQCLGQRRVSAGGRVRTQASRVCTAQPRAAGRMTSEAGCRPVPARHKVRFRWGGSRLRRAQPEASHELQRGGPKVTRTPGVVRPSDRSVGGLAKRRGRKPQPRVGIPGNRPPGRLSSCRHDFLLLSHQAGLIVTCPNSPWYTNVRRPRLATLGHPSP